MPKPKTRKNGKAASKANGKPTRQQLAESDAGEGCRGPLLALVEEVRRLRASGLTTCGPPEYGSGM